MFGWLVLLAAWLLLGVTPALALPLPSPSSSPSPSANIPTGSATPTIKISGKALVASLGAGKPDVWKMSFLSAPDKGPGKLIGPVVMDRLLYLGYGPFLVAVDPVAGKVERRWRFPGALTVLEPATPHLRLEVQTPAGIRVPMLYAPTGPGPVLVTSGLLAHIVALRVDAARVMDRFRLLELDPAVRKPRDAVAEQALAKYVAAAERDPTNPWYLIGQARANEDLGRAGEALALYRKVLDASGLVFYDYTQLSVIFEGLGKRSLAEQAFDLGLKDFLSRGYDPELLQSLLQVLAYQPDIRQTGQRLKQMDPDRLLEVQERLFRLAPWPEGAFQAYAGTGRYLDQQGRFKQSRPWWDRAAQAKARSYMGVNALLLRLDLLINLMVGLAIALAIWAAILLAKYRLPPEGVDRRYHTLYLLTGRYLSRAELLGNLSLAILTGAAVVLTTLEMSVLGNVVQAPYSFLSGTIGHPDSVQFLDRQAPTPERDFLLGLAYHQAGNSLRAAEFYGRLAASARAHNNLGVLAVQGGNQAGARQEFEAARRRDPKLLEARFNLGERVASERAEVYARYLPGKPLLATPTGDDYRVALRPANPNFFVASQQMAELMGKADTIDRLVYALLLACYLFFLLTSFSALLLPRIGEWEQPMLGNRWWGGLLVPGLAPQWAALGPALMALWFGAIATLYHDHRWGVLGSASAAAAPGWPPGMSLGFYPRPAFTDEWLLRVELAMIALWLLNVLWLCLARFTFSRPDAGDFDESLPATEWDVEEIKR